MGTKLLIASASVAGSPKTASWGARLRSGQKPLFRDRKGAVSVEAALVLPVLILLLFGIVTYGLWLMTANSLQQVANEAARATLGSLNATERQQRVMEAISTSLRQTGAVAQEDVTITTAVSGAYYTVTLTYDTSAHALFSTSLVPLPGNSIVRRATVETGGL